MSEWNKSELEIEKELIATLNDTLGIEFLENVHTYDSLKKNLKNQLSKRYAAELVKKNHSPEFSDKEFKQILTELENKSVYEAAKFLRSGYDVELDSQDEDNVLHIDFFSPDGIGDVYQVAHQIEMGKKELGDTTEDNRYDVTILRNGIPVIQIELKRPDVEIDEALNQVNRYRARTFKKLFHNLQILIVSNSRHTRYFANQNEIKAKRPRYIQRSETFEWKDEDGRIPATLNDFALMFLNKEHMTEMLDKFFIIRENEKTLLVMRPYQIAAYKAVLKRVLIDKSNGYVWASTGSGKTLTSWACAKELAHNKNIDLVCLLVDRTDLDEQTLREYNSFENGFVDGAKSVKTLVKTLQNIFDHKQKKTILITTIQKMKDAIEKLDEKYKNKNVVFITDECHRTQGGQMHLAIERFFEKGIYIGFTGTPIFEENAGCGLRTTADIFAPAFGLDACLHKYMISDAIADENVLPFSVEWVNTITHESISGLKINKEYVETIKNDKHGNLINNRTFLSKAIKGGEKLFDSEKRINKVAKHIIDHHWSHTRLSEATYTSLFGVNSIDILGKYYDSLNKYNGELPEDEQLKIAVLFTVEANPYLDEEIEDHRDLLDRCIADYNKMFKTNFSYESRDAYQSDLISRLKISDSKSDDRLDLCIVVNMLLTGFDSKACNTLYLDKDLKDHSLVQAYSRTNRVYKRSKKFGQIISYRYICEEQDRALSLFSDGADPNKMLIRPYNEYLGKWKIVCADFRRKVKCSADDIRYIKSESEKKDFIYGFRALSGVLSVLKTFVEFSWDDISSQMTEDEYRAYKSEYAELADNRGREDPYNYFYGIDFEMDRIRTDTIDVDYILNLIKDAHSSKEDENEKFEKIKQELARTDSEILIRKADVIDAFIEKCKENFPENTDIAAAYREFEKDYMNKEISIAAKKYHIDENIYEQELDKISIGAPIDSSIIFKAVLDDSDIKLLEANALVDQIANSINVIADKYIRKVENYD